MTEQKPESLAGTMRRALRIAEAREMDDERLAKRNAAIPAKFMQLCRDAKISMVLSPPVGDAVADAALVALWNAIVDADASL